MRINTKYIFCKPTHCYYIIANPPYGAWQEYAKRKELKQLYPGLYVRETYGLFLYQALRLLKPGGRLVFIIPDTYLNLHMHKPLRHAILTQSCVEEIALFPSSFFPGVSFGYSNLSIVTLHRSTVEEAILENKLRVTWGYETVDQLQAQPASLHRMEIPQRNLLDAIDHALFVTDKPQYSSLILGANKRIGDIASCVTGIYSGNDKSFLRVLSHEIRNGAKYLPVSQDSVYRGGTPSLDGLTKSECFVPIVKGGGVRFIKPDLWFLDWSADAVRHYKTDKKARFQNSQFYFRTGIAIPMVSSNNVTAALIQSRLFDQSIVGVFPNDNRYLHYLLGFFNTDLCTTLLRIINPSANNSANYVKKLPFVVPSSDELQMVSALVEQLISDVRNTGGYRDEDMKSLNRMFQEIYTREEVSQS
jgi:hypothetical protein